MEVDNKSKIQDLQPILLVLPLSETHCDGDVSVQVTPKQTNIGLYGDSENDDDLRNKYDNDDDSGDDDEQRREGGGFGHQSTICLIGLRGDLQIGL